MARIMIDREHAEHCAAMELPSGFGFISIPQRDGRPSIAVDVCERDGALYCTDGFGGYELECKTGDVVAHVVGYLKWTPEQLAELVREALATECGEDVTDAEAIEAEWTTLED